MKDLARLQQEIRVALAKSQCRAAAYFGSIAKGTADDLSDADLIVCCDHAAATRFRTALHETLGVALYRPFDSREPSGRYWFKELSPYAKLDVSFHYPAEYDALLAEGGPFIEPPFREIDVMAGPQSRNVRATIPVNTAEEIAFSKLLYKYQVGTKRALRGQACKEDIEVLDADLRCAVQEGLSDSVARLYRETKKLYSSPDDRLCPDDVARLVRPQPGGKRSTPAVR